VSWGPQIDREKWRRKFSEAGIDGRLAAQLAQLVRPSVTLTAEPTASEDSLLIGSSKLGGRPDLPVGLPWPARPPYAWEVPQQHRPLAFLAQIALSDIAAVGGTDLELPNCGLLSFFYDADDQPLGIRPEDRAGFNLMWSGDRALQRREPPETLRERFNAVRLSARARECIPSTDTFAVSEILDGAVDAGFNRDKLNNFLYEDKRGEYSNKKHDLGGWPSVIEGQMETECQLVTNGILAAVRKGAPANARRGCGPAPPTGGSFCNWTLMTMLDGCGATWADSTFGCGRRTCVPAASIDAGRFCNAVDGSCLWGSQSSTSPKFWIARV
jgi:hypothetical protein